MKKILVVHASVGFSSICKAMLLAEELHGNIYVIGMSSKPLPALPNTTPQLEDKVFKLLDRKIDKIIPYLK
jgi:hypothetical protein